MKTIVSIAAMLAIVVTAAPAEAKKKRYVERERAPKHDCKAPITVEGPSVLGKDRAKEAAIEKWHESAFKTYGIYYGAWEDAREKTDPICGRLKVQYTCTVTASPCRNKG